MARDQIGQDSAGVGVLLAGIAEDVVLFTVAVKIEAGLYPEFLRYLLDLLLYLVDLSMEYL